MFYLVLKALHIISVVAWMAGLLYLPRLFVYHSAVNVGSETSETFKLMERRLATAIMTPAMAATWIFGLWLAVEGQWLKSPWFHAKFLLVLGLSAAHAYLLKSMRRFAADERPGNGRFWRLINEIPTLLMIGIVVLVVLKPF